MKEIQCIEQGRLIFDPLLIIFLICMLSIQISNYINSVLTTNVIVEYVIHWSIPIALVGGYLLGSYVIGKYLIKWVRL